MGNCLNRKFDVLEGEFLPRLKAFVEIGFSQCHNHHQMLARSLVSSSTPTVSPPPSQVLPFNAPSLVDNYKTPHVPYSIEVCANHGVRVLRDVGICYLTLYDTRVLDRGQSDKVAQNPLALTSTRICTRPSQKARWGVQLSWVLVVISNLAFEYIVFGDVQETLGKPSGEDSLNDFLQERKELRKGARTSQTGCLLKGVGKDDSMDLLGQQLAIRTSQANAVEPSYSNAIESDRGKEREGDTNKDSEVKDGAGGKGDEEEVEVEVKEHVEVEVAVVVVVGVEVKVKMVPLKKMRKEVQVREIMKVVKVKREKIPKKWWK
ncbi:hypothetical protein Syun_008842 [Stephania yunnanensis]|uniref:Uncharacterized protein n=1 Tax=Stephania yunnanensis TaxID=152371 RepID=A0AAP0PMY4_9MAGN